jgi:cytochrome P450
MVLPGMGLHQCVGRHVARPEVEALLTSLARRVRSIEFAGPIEHHNNALRAWESIPLRLRAD